MIRDRKGSLFQKEAPSHEHFMNTPSGNLFLPQEHSMLCPCDTSSKPATLSNIYLKILSLRSSLRG